MRDFISKFDTQNQFEVLRKSYSQIDDAWDKKVDLGEIGRNKYNAVLICGLGGSGIGGDLLKDFLYDDLNVPILVNKDYKLPSFVNKGWLIIISSYSGNTEETISCMEQALKLNTGIITLSSGGKIEEIAGNNSIPHIKINSGFLPRYAIGLSFFTMLKILQEVFSINKQDNIVKAISALWKKRAEEYSHPGNYPNVIAKKLIGFLPVIYSSEFLASAAYRFKCQLNENSKVHAFRHVIPEMNHNEIIGWETYNEKQFKAKIILLYDNDYHPRIKKRYSVFSEIAASRGVEIINLASSEKIRQVRIMDLIFLCDWISFYLAVLRGFDPSEIDFIHEMKKRLV